MGDLVNIGVLGCANIADRFVIPAIVDLNKKFKLLSVASRNKDKAVEFSRKYNCKPYFDYDHLINDTALDAVYIPLPNQLHAEWINKALTKGLHVLVEKSLACSYEDVVLLNKLAREKNLVILENFQFRFHSQLGYVSDLIQKGVLGDLRCVRSSFGFPPFPDDSNIRYSKELGGGALLDAGAYPLKVSQLIMGGNIKVDAANLFIDKEKGVDIWGGAYLSQNNGSLFSEIAFGFDNSYQCSLEIWGSEGRLYTNRIFTAAPNVKPVFELETKSGKEVVELIEDHHFINMLLHFHGLVQKKECLVEYEQNVNQARLINELKVKAGIG